MDEAIEWSAERIDAITAWTLVQASHAVGRALYELFGEQQLTPVQFGVLAQLAVTPDLNGSELARRVLIRPQSMGEVISTLVDRGHLVRRNRGGRGRPVSLQLTEQGRTTLDRAGAALDAMHDSGGLGLAPVDLRTLNELLHTVTDALVVRE